MELRTLRLDRNMNQDRLGRLIGRSRMEISRLEIGQSSDQAAVLDILDALGATGEQWTALATLAEEASLQGWWESVRRMGERQALFANLEAGATRICAYEQTSCQVCCNCRRTSQDAWRVWRASSRFARLRSTGCWPAGPAGSATCAVSVAQRSRWS
jgi:transcriptional regulator with XRE-family HTH domain